MRRILLVGCLSAAVVLAGCGGDEEPMIIAPYEDDVMVRGADRNVVDDDLVSNVPSLPSGRVVRTGRRRVRTWMPPRPDRACRR